MSKEMMSFVWRVPEGAWINIPGTFDLKQIADSGQCFRLTPLQGGGYVAATKDHLVKIVPHKEGGYVFHCPLKISGMYGLTISILKRTMQHIKRK